MQPSHQDPALRTARAITADYYHVAPTTERNRILQHGLQPSNPMLNTDWGGLEAWHRRHGPDAEIPTGVYMWEKPGQAYNFAESYENGRDTPADVWRIPGEREVYSDPDIPWAKWTPEPVMDAELHEGPEDRVWDTQNKVPYEQVWNDFKPLNLNQDTNDFYDELWNQRVGE